MTREEAIEIAKEIAKNVPCSVSQAEAIYTLISLPSQPQATEEEIAGLLLKKIRITIEELTT